MPHHRVYMKLYSFPYAPFAGEWHTCCKKSVDERLIVFQAPVIGYDTTLPMWLGRRYTVKVFQSLSSCTMLCSKAVSLSALQERALRQKDRIRAIYKSCSLNRTRHMWPGYEIQKGSSVLKDNEATEDKLKFRKHATATSENLNRWARSAASFRGANWHVERFSMTTPNSKVRYYRNLLFSIFDRIVLSRSRSRLCISRQAIAAFLVPK